MESCCGRVDRSWKISGHSHQHPLTGINIMEYSSQLKEEADKLLKDYMIRVAEDGREDE